MRTNVWAERPLAPVMAGATCIIACTAAAAARLQHQFPGALIQMVHHGLAASHLESKISASSNLRPAPPPLRIISAGRLIGKKGVDTLIDACGILSHNNLDYRCEIYGSGELEQRLQNQIHRLGLSDRVALHPFAPFHELCGHIRQAHLFVLPCRIDPASGDRDGIPNVLLEAQTGGAIVIAGDTPAIRELIDHQVTGFLVRPNSPRHLARLIEEVLGLRSNWPQLRQRAHEKILRDFSLDSNLCQLKVIIEHSVLSCPKQLSRDG